jgi:hypothetical protein
VRAAQDIAFGVSGQVLVFDAPEGRPSSVTSVEVFRWDAGDDDTAEGATTGSATVETNPDTTTDAACGASQDDPRRVPLTATTSCATDRRYLLTGADLVKEWVDVQDVDSGDAVIARHPLHNDYASGATFESTRIQVTVDSTWCADETHLDDTPGPSPMYRVRWVYVVAGVTYPADTYFNLVRYPGRHGVLPQDVEATLPGWLDSLPTDHRRDQGRRLIDEAHRTVRLDLYELREDDAAIADTDIIDELTRYKAIELSVWARFMSSPSDDGSKLAVAEKRYETRLAALLKLTKKAPVRDVDGAADNQRPALSLSQR